VFKFLFKLIFIGVIIGGVFSVYYSRTGKTPDPSKIFSQLQAVVKTRSLDPLNIDLKDIDASSAARQVGGALDSLVTHQGTNSPVVLGVKITNDSLNSFVDLIQKMPPDQVQELKNIICKP
jgi:hypothetical protein